MSVESRRQGYVTIAYGARKYLEMAVNLALSAKLNDSTRPILLLAKDCDSIPEETKAHFDLHAELQTPDDLRGSAVKLNIFDVSPFDENMYVDADCLFMKPDMGRHWRKFSGHDFSIPGSKRTSGRCYGLDVGAMMQAAGVDFIYQINAGLIYFKRNEAARRVFEEARALFKAGDPALMNLRRKRGSVAADQPFFAAAMAKCGVDAISYTPAEGTVMATTYLAKGFEFDIEKGVSRLKKATGYWLMDRFLAKGWVEHDTSIGHFIGLRPEAQYQRLSDVLRDRFGVPRYQFFN